ncbi:proton-coupled zinc antiporter SLC30A1-like [Neoarius graeffei]|uniref:proton-coupled zinc antiporter SLC30A1-like n=1 Tax=Neoarius graeffei TaxID=443677 RepID=UPI00298D44D0|nr:proton-coupled zinc antiporter SLC30A1-like [Neoarius graeffei]
MACEPNHARLLCMLSLTFSFFVVEVVVSQLTSSLAMRLDSFYMLLDVMALIVALVAVCFAERTQSTKKNTFGWIRAEVMGALINAVLLTALCFTIVLKAIEHFTELHEIENPIVVITVGVAGLVVNLLGLCLFHSHGKMKHAKRNTSKSETSTHCRSAGEETNNLVTRGHGRNSPNGMNPDSRGAAELSTVQLNDELTHEHDLEQENDASSASQLNMRGVFLYVLGDALGSVIVVVSSIIFTFVWRPCEPGVPCKNPCVANTHCSGHYHLNHTLVGFGEEELNNMSTPFSIAGPCWVLYLDPTLCLIMVCILLYMTYPLLKESALILLQTVPKQFDVSLLSTRLRQINGVLAVHELHIWQLAGSRFIATAHIKCRDPASYMSVAKRMKAFFHDEGIHATTIQPEFVMVSSELHASLCELSCRTQCATKLCCQNAKAADNKNTGMESESEAEPPGSTTLEVISESLESEPQVQVASKDVAITSEVESSL